MSNQLQCVCGRPYALGPDLLLPDDVWKKIAPYENGGGVLCPNCIHDRLVAAGFEVGSVLARFVSGPMACSLTMGADKPQLSGSSGDREWTFKPRLPVSLDQVSRHLESESPARPSLSCTFGDSAL